MVIGSQPLLIQMFLSCTSKATDYSYTSCRGWNSLLNRRRACYLDRVTITFQLYMRARSPEKDSWDSSLASSGTHDNSDKATKREGSGGTRRKGHLSCQKSLELEIKTAFRSAPHYYWLCGELWRSMVLKRQKLRLNVFWAMALQVSRIE